MSAVTNRTRGSSMPAGRRAIPTTSSKVVSVRRAASRLVPTLPVAPVMTSFMPRPYPGRATVYPSARRASARIPSRLAAET
jgi:hypothetical protein